LGRFPLVEGGDGCAEGDAGEFSEGDDVCIHERSKSQHDISPGIGGHSTPTGEGLFCCRDCGVDILFVCKSNVVGQEGTVFRIVEGESETSLFYVYREGIDW